MKNLLEEELKNLGESDGEDIENEDRRERNRKIIAAYYEPVKRAFPVKKFVCALCSVTVLTAACIALPLALRGDETVYMDYSCVKTDLSMSELSREAGVNLPDVLGGYTVSSAALYYEKETERTLVVTAVYSSAASQFLVSVAVDKNYAPYMSDYGWFSEAAEPAEVGGKTVLVSRFGEVAVIKYETENRFLGFRFDSMDREDALRIADEVING